MKYQIDPTIDFVFKFMLGSEGRKPLTLHFLNAYLEGTGILPIVDVTLINPYNARETFDEKETVVDVLAKDSAGRIYQIEMQSEAFRALPERMLYTWAQLYSKQLEKGQDYTHLCAAASIWIVNDRLPGFHDSAAGGKRRPASSGRHGDEEYYHRYVVYDPALGVQLSSHLTLVTVELPKAKQVEPTSNRDRWTRFFREAMELDDEHLPEYMETPEMKQALNALKEIEENTLSLHQYHARLDYLRTQSTIAKEIRDLNQALKLELQEAESRRVRAEDHVIQVQQSWRQSEREKEDALERERRAVQERQRAEQEKQRAEQEKQQAEQEKRQAEQEKQQAEQEKRQAQQEKQQAEQEKQQALQQAQVLEALIKQLKAQGSP